MRCSANWFERANVIPVLTAIFNSMFSHFKASPVFMDNGKPAVSGVLVG